MLAFDCFTVAQKLVIQLGSPPCGSLFLIKLPRVPPQTMFTYCPYISFRITSHFDVHSEHFTDSMNLFAILVPNFFFCP